MNAASTQPTDRHDDLPLRRADRVRSATMVQRWTDLSFISWPYAPPEVARLLPPGLEIDTFDGAAWVSLLPFRLSIRLPGLPRIPWASRFPEVNLRTYVRGPDGRRGIWFCSLDASRLGAVAVARRSYRLPYMWARARLDRRGDLIRYTGHRRWPKAGADWDLSVDVGGEMPAVDPLHRFLTSRWRLYSPRPLELPATAISFVVTVVDHAPWPLRYARLAHGRTTLPTAAGLPASSQAPVVAFSPGVTVRFAPRSRVG